MLLHNDEILEDEAVGMAFPVDSTYFEQYAAVDDVQDNVKQLRELTSVKYGEQYLLEKTFPHLFPYGEGGWFYK